MIEINTEICPGKPVIQGTRIMVANILSLFVGGYTVNQIQQYYPELTAENIKECIPFLH